VSENYGNWLKVDKVIAMQKGAVFWSTLYFPSPCNVWTRWNLCVRKGIRPKRRLDRAIPK